jgi:hypothetical protein
MMATVRSGLFTLKEFSYRRNVLKLAPDTFVVINGALASRVLSPLEATSTQDIDIRGGIVSVNVSCAISPPGASRATIEITAPMYKGLHEDYYVSMPNGTRVPFFTPMMEVKVYMKGRYLEQEFNYVPRYYPVFWGMITGIQENYSGGNFNITVTCEDFLAWWKYQRITVNPSATDSFFGGAVMNRFPSVFEKMSAWEIIYAMFTDSFFVQHLDSGAEAYYNFVYPKWSKSANLPVSVIPTRDTFGPMSSLVIDYWNQRFGMGVSKNSDPALIADQLEKIPLQMYGLKGPIKFDTIKNKMLNFLDKKSGMYGEQADRRADIDLDFGLLARVQPYGLFDLFGQGTEPTVFSKLEIATTICEKVFMEFFVDTNGAIVFKPPFYNLDVASGNVKYYRVGPEEVINFNASFDSNAIVNYLTVTGPMYQSLSSLEAVGFHADFDSIRRYGIRSDQINVPYGMNGKQLKMIAVAEMNRRNGQAYTGSVSIPLRPELRLGYPVYLEHIDTFYYVTGISHSFSFGSSATTDLTLQFRREKIFEDGRTGLIDSQVGDVLYSCVMRNNEKEIADELNTTKPDIEKLKERIEGLSKASDLLKTGTEVSQKYNYKDLDKFSNELGKQIIATQNGVFDGPGLLGLWKIDRAVIKQRTSEQITNAGDEAAYSANELVMMTDATVPYTDKLGYRHMGAFPYGANLVLTKDGQMRDTTNFIDRTDMSVDSLLNSCGIRDETATGISSEANQDISGNVVNDSTYINEDKEVTVSKYQDKVNKARDLNSDQKMQQNEQGNPDIYNTDRTVEGLASIGSIEGAVKMLMDVPLGMADTCVRESNQNESTYSG